MKNLFIITGVPGAGKTTYLAKQAAAAAKKHGSDTVWIASLTKTAAAEIAGRDVPIPKEQVGTLHSHAYRALGTSNLMQTSDGLKDWNQWIDEKKLGSLYSLSLDKTADIDDMSNEIGTGGAGDKVFEEYNLLRNRMIDRSLWPKRALAFAAQWEEWKADRSGIDFSDMIELALTEDVYLPAETGIFDEVQDFSALELALVMKWAERMEFVVLAGDSDQTLFCFRGAEARNIYGLPVDEANKRFLLKSYRCPRAVVAYANRVISQCKERENIFMQPKDADGEFRRSPASIWEPEIAVSDARQYLEAGKSVAFLTTAGYMLDSLIGDLRANGIPYENRFRRKNHTWNPLFCANGVSAKDRLLMFTEGGEGWSNDDVYNWSLEFEAGKTMTRGAKTEIEKARKEPFSLSKMREWFAPCWPEPLRFNPDWYIEQMLASKKAKYKYPLTIMRKRGKAALSLTPQITVGTIHSVKGATFDAVYIFPDISPSCYDECHYSVEGRNSAYRTWYVGASRAAESLIVCEPCTEFVTPFEG